MSNYNQRDNSSQHQKNSDSLSAAEKYAFEFQNNDPKYYAQIPAILFYSTYVAKEPRKDNINFDKLVRKKLSTFAITLYTFIKQLAGRKGEVWMTTEELAEHCNMSPGSVSNAKKELLQPIEQLNGKCFLEIRKKKKKFTHPDGKPGITEYDCCTTTHIWPENNAYMATLSHHPDLKLGLIENVHNQSADSRRESDDPSDSRRECGSLGSDSRRERVNRTDKEESLSKKTEETAEPSVCSLDKEDCFVPSDQLANDVHVSLDQIEDLKEVFRKLGGDESFIRWLFKTFPAQKIIKAGQYYDQRNKIKPITNSIAYIRTALEKGWV